MLYNDQEVPTIVLKDAVLYPGCTMAFVVTRQKSINAINKAFEDKKPVFCIAQKNHDKETGLTAKDLYKIGTIGEIMQKVSAGHNEVRVLMHGIEKATMEDFIETQDLYKSIVQKIKTSSTRDDSEKVKEICQIIVNKATSFLKATSNLPIDLFTSIKTIDRPEDIVFLLTALLNLEMDAKQAILEEKTKLKQLYKLHEYLETQVNLFNTEKTINERIAKKIQDNQKQFFLREKLKLIKKELKTCDDEDDGAGDIGTFKKRAKNIKFSDEAEEKFKSEIKKLASIPVYSPEYSTIREHIEWLIDLPWNKKSLVTNDVKKAEDILNRDQYGLEEVKERILEFIAVYSKTKKLHGPIICLVGPPGVGKTSLARSIAEALNRKYIKVSLGGVRDEAEIRGHRKTYVAAMPGKIIQSMRKAKVSNPLMLLDEIDKMASDVRGDPASALLEVLDPEQNKAFHDHFLEVEYDLSDVMFIATANDLTSIPLPLRDRMEIIKISGYTEDEKLEIAKRHIIPKLLELHGLKTKEFKIDNKSILRIIREYTFEAGVRNLERSLETLIRKCTKKLVEDKNKKSIKITEDNLKDYLGVGKYSYNRARKEPVVGVTNGLAYTDFGGDILYIEALKFDGSGKLLITGKIGEVMKESVEAALSYVRSKAINFGITSEIFNKYDFHLHVPEGATPKDGPSAGIAIAGALMSLVTDMKVRGEVAMTGEITLTGEVLPIGGLKEKLLGALRGGIKKVIIPFENIKDLEKIPSKVQEQMKILPVKNIEEAFKILLIGYKNGK